MRYRVQTIDVTQSPRRSLVAACLAKGHRWVWWWPDGMKMSGFVGRVDKGRVVVVKPCA